MGAHGEPTAMPLQPNPLLLALFDLIAIVIALSRMLFAA